MICKECNTEKTAEDFYKANKSVCKVCILVRNKKQLVERKALAAAVDQNTLKYCEQCKQSLPLKKFPVNFSCKDFRSNKCNACTYGIKKRRIEVDHEANELYGEINRLINQSKMGNRIFELNINDDDMQKRKKTVIGLRNIEVFDLNFDENKIVLKIYEDTDNHKVLTDVFNTNKAVKRPEFEDGVLLLECNLSKKLVLLYSNYKEIDPLDKDKYFVEENSYDVILEVGVLKKIRRMWAINVSYLKLR